MKGKHMRNFDKAMIMQKQTNLLINDYKKILNEYSEFKIEFIIFESRLLITYEKKEYTLDIIQENNQLLWKLTHKGKILKKYKLFENTFEISNILDYIKNK